MHLQNWIHRLTEGAVANALRLIAAVLGFVVLAVAYDLHSVKNLPSQEAMENAQLARNLALGKGYTTQSIRPLDLSLLEKHSPGSIRQMLHSIPDLRTPPVYPLLLAGVFKALPFNLSAGQDTFPRVLELWIIGLNQALFFIAVLLLFTVARELFDNTVAWSASVLFAATDLFWKFTLSGISTMLLIVIFLAIVWCLKRIEKRNQPSSPAQPGGIRLALALGALVAIGGLTRYSFAWLIIPVIIFLSLSVSQKRGRLCLAAVLAFLVVISPWLARNYSLVEKPFGTAAFALFQDTQPFPGDVLERSFDLTNGFNRLEPHDYIDKLMVNMGRILQNDLPKAGGNWISAFFLVGLLIPFRNQILSRIRLFLLGSLALFVCVQALGQTHITTDLPEFNSENLMVILAPLTFIFGVGLFFTLFEQLSEEIHESKNLILGFLGAAVCAPFILVFLSPPAYPDDSPFDSYYIRRITQWMGDKETMASDVPSAVAWYGRHSCAWLPLNDKDQFAQLHSYQPIQAVYLTQRTTDHYLSQRAANPETWERFALECWAHSEVPDNFPLTNAPTGFLPDRIFLSDKERWQTEIK